jgi:uncharacterized protein
VWETAAAVDPEALRREVFVRSSEARRGGTWNRDEILSAAAAEVGIDKNAAERSLYADLAASQRLVRVGWTSPEALVRAYESGQAQAVLLRATDLSVSVRCASAGAARAFLHRLKFLQLLCVVEPEPGGYRLAIDGPMSLFESSTKYGLKLAQLLPLLDLCDAWDLTARVKWGRDRRRLPFRLSGEGTAAASKEVPELCDDARAFVVAWKKLESDWSVAPARAVLTLPGAGLCVPDLEFTRGRERVYLEIMGYWSRQAVFRRVELVKRGLADKIIFAVSRRLRVSEAVLGEHPSAALYVYTNVMSVRSVADRLARITSG